MPDRKISFRKPLTFAVDLVLMLIVIIVLLAEYSGSWNLAYLFSVNRVAIIIYMIVTGAALLLFRCYETAINDYTFYDSIRLVGAIVLSQVFFEAAMSVAGQPFAFFFVLNLAMYTATIFGLYRLATFFINHIGYNLAKPEKSSDMRRVIIFGAGNAGKYLVDMLKQDRSKRMLPVAFIDDDPKLERKKIKGLLVVGPRMLIPYAAAKYKADIIIIAIPFVDNSTIREIFNLCCEANCTVKRFGNMSNLAFDGLAKSTISEVRLEDLLQREVVRLDLESVSGLIKNKVVLVTGGAGSIGSELCRQIMHYGAKHLVIYDFNENGLFNISMELKQNYHESMFSICLASIRDKDVLDATFEKFKPNIVFHAAAYKHVPMMEGNLREALINNIIGTQNVVDASVANNAERFIMISTDKAVNPTNIMGATKRVAELIMQRKNMQGGKTLFTAVRFGNVLGSNGSVIPIFQKQIQMGGPITVTHKDIKRYFMTIPEAVQLVLEAACLTKGGEIFVLDMGEPVKIYDLAETMIKLSGLEPDKDIKIEITGLRPGEKLFEELSLSDETLIKTSNNKIFILKSSDDIPFENIVTCIDKLMELTKKKDYDRAFQNMKTLVPSLKNSARF